MLADHSEPPPPARIKRKRRNRACCPFCSVRLHKTAKGGRRKRVCDSCGAGVDRSRTSSCCPSAELWRLGTRRRCFTCGKPIRTES